MSLPRYLLAKSPPEDEPFEGASVYRRLVRANLRSVIDNAFPVTRAVLAARWEALVDAFLDAGGPETPLYKDVPGELVSWAQVSEEPYADLLHYEWLELVAARHPAEIDALPPAEGRVVPNPTLQVALYLRPVHLISAELPEPEPFDAPSAYLVWRRPKTDEVAFHRAGLLIGRALELAAARARAGAPLTLRGLALELAREAHLAAEVIEEALGACLDELAEREGVAR